MGDTKVAGRILMGVGGTGQAKSQDGGEEKTAHIELQLPLWRRQG
jgi:hypothetical protein